MVVKKRTAVTANGKGVPAAGPVPAAKVVAQGPYTDYTMQLTLVVALLAPWVVAINYLEYDPKVVQSELYASLHLQAGLSSFEYMSTPSFWKLVAVLATPHVFYFFVWTRADRFYQTFKGLGEPYQVFSQCAHLIKILQIFSTLIYFIGVDTLTSEPYVKSFLGEFQEYTKSANPFQVLLGFQLFFLGQLFNYYVYKTIGEDGVYYGCRLGREVPWFYGFPFSTVPHPQYLGATLSCWGAVVLFATEANVAMGLWFLGPLLTVYYVFSSLVEAYL